MRHQLLKDYKKRNLMKKAEENKIKKRIVKNNLILESDIRNIAQRLYVENENLGSISKIRNRCLVTGRGRGIIGEFGISRIIFRQWGDKGLIAGVRRACW